MRALVVDNDIQETKPCDYIFKQKLHRYCGGAIFHRCHFCPSCQLIGSSYNIARTNPFPWRTNRADKIHRPFIKGLQCNLWRKWHFITSWWFPRSLALVTIMTLFSCIHMYIRSPESNLQNLVHHFLPDVVSSWDTRMRFIHYPFPFMIRDASMHYFI